MSISNSELEKSLDLVPKRNIKHLFGLMQTDYNPNMSLEQFTDLLLSNKKLHSSFFNKATLGNKKPAIQQQPKEKEIPPAVIHPCLIYETDEELYIPQYVSSKNLEVKN